MEEPDGPPIDLDSSRNLAPIATMCEAALAVLAILLGWWWGSTPGESLALDYLPWDARLRSLGWGLAASLPPLAGLVFVQRTDWPPLARLHHLVQQQILPWFATTSKVEFALLSFAAGVGEELLFRGLFQVGIGNWIGGAAGPWCGLIVASLAFGVGHAMTPAYFVLATGMGIYLGVLYWLSGDLLAPIVTHAVYDYVALVWLVHRDQASSQNNLPN